MSTRRSSVSCENLPKELASKDSGRRSGSSSADNLHTASSERAHSADSIDDLPNISCQVYDNVCSDDAFSCTDAEKPCDKVKKVLLQKATKDEAEFGSLPCDSCEFIEPVDYVEVTYCWGCCKRTKSWYKISEYWIISVPKEENTLVKLNEATQSLSQNYKFHTPMLKVGVLNTLIENMDHLKTLDSFVNEVLENLVKILKTQLGKEKDRLDENLKVNDLSPATYLTRFNWNRSKYPPWHHIAVIADEIYSYVDSINECMKQKLSQLDKINADIKPYEKRETEDLKIRYLGDIVKKEHFVQNSKFLTTLLVVVPNKKRKFWKTRYADLSEMIVPDSSVEVYNDGTDSLYTVTLSLKDVELFKRNAAIHNFIVRDYQYSEENQTAEKAYYENRARAKLELQADILKYVKITFGETFEAWIHVKVLRSFVESVVRFGLPVNYESMLILPLKSKAKLRKTLQKLYKNVDVTLAIGNMENIPGSLASYYDVDEYYPFVYFNINLGFIYK